MWLQVREVYERAIANVPPAPEKRYWQRYIYLWINYALWEELEAEDPARTRDVYRACLDLMPHSTFTFAKVWVHLLMAQPNDCADIIAEFFTSSNTIAQMSAQTFQVHHSHLNKHVLLSTVIGSPLDFLRKGCIHLEGFKSAADADLACRCGFQIWIMAAQFEVRQLQLGAARKLLGRAIGQCPKAKLFRGYIELELQLGAIERVRTLLPARFRHFTTAALADPDCSM